LGIATFILAGSLAADFIVPKVWRLVIRRQNAAFRKVCEARYGLDIGRMKIWHALHTGAGIASIHGTKKAANPFGLAAAMERYCAETV
jgi:hypothetical protein